MSIFSRPLREASSSLSSFSSTVFPPRVTSRFFQSQVSSLPNSKTTTAADSFTTSSHSLTQVRKRFHFLNLDSSTFSHLLTKDSLKSSLTSNSFPLSSCSLALQSLSSSLSPPLSSSFTLTSLVSSSLSAALPSSCCPSPSSLSSCPSSSLPSYLPSISISSAFYPTVIDGNLQQDLTRIRTTFSNQVLMIIKEDIEKALASITTFFEQVAENIEDLQDALDIIPNDVSKITNKDQQDALVNIKTLSSKVPESTSKDLQEALASITTLFNKVSKSTNKDLQETLDRITKFFDQVPTITNRDLQKVLTCINPLCTNPTITNQQVKVILVNIKTLSENVLTNIKTYQKEVLVDINTRIQALFVKVLTITKGSLQHVLDSIKDLSDQVPMIINGDLQEALDRIKIFYTITPMTLSNDLYAALDCSSIKTLLKKDLKSINGDLHLTSSLAIKLFFFSSAEGLSNTLIFRNIFSTTYAPEVWIKGDSNPTEALKMFFFSLINFQYLPDIQYLQVAASQGCLTQEEFVTKRQLLDAEIATYYDKALQAAKNENSFWLSIPYQSG